MTHGMWEGEPINPCYEVKGNTLLIGRAKKHLKVPEGWEIVTGEGEQVKSGDMFLFVGNGPKACHWQSVTSEDIGDSICLYECVIRQR